MTTFNIIEDTNYTEKFWEEYEKIKTDVVNGLTTKEILKKHNLTRSNYRKYRKELQEKGVIDKRYCGKHYRKLSNGKYVIRKYNGTTQEYFGTYKSKEDAIKVINELKKCNWDKTKLKEIRERLGV